MTEQDRGKDRAGRRAKRFLTPSEKYEIWLQIVRQEVTIAEAAHRECPKNGVTDHGVSWLWWERYDLRR